MSNAYAALTITLKWLGNPLNRHRRNRKSIFKHRYLQRALLNNYSYYLKLK